MDYTNLPKQTFADLIALRQAVVALINLLPEKEKELQLPQLYSQNCGSLSQSVHSFVSLNYSPRATLRLSSLILK